MIDDLEHMVVPLGVLDAWLVKINLLEAMTTLLDIPICQVARDGAKQIQHHVR